MEPSIIEELLKEAKKNLNDFESTELKCGVIGNSGAGKSSLINAILGQKIAEVGTTEQTMEAQEFFHNGIKFVDLPGCGTKSWPAENYIDDLNLLGYDCFIIVSSVRYTESDLFLYEELSRNNKKCFIVRNKIDLDIESELYDNDLSESQTLIKVNDYIEIQLLPISGTVKIFLTSARHPTKWGLAELIDAICNSQTKVKRDRAHAGLAAWTEDAVRGKRDIGKKLVGWHAVTAAANGINPIPGVNIAVDIGVLQSLCNKLDKIYGLTEIQLKAVGVKESNTEFQELKKKVRQWQMLYTAKEGAVTMLKQLGKKQTFKYASRYIPIVGQLVSAGMGYQMTIMFGDKYLNEAEGLACEILKIATFDH